MLRRPQVLNAMSVELFDDLATAVDLVAAGDARVLVVSGEGRSFSSGIDVNSLGTVTGAPPEMVARAQAGFRKLAALPIPTIAVVQGHALGAGFQLALACDLRVVASDTQLGLLEAYYGLIPDLGGSTKLPQLVGVGRAKKMIWLAEKITGEEAGHLGIAEVVVAADALAATADELAARLARVPATVATEAKRLLDAAPRLDIAAGMDAEAQAQLRCMAAPEFGQAVRGATARQ